MQPHVFLLLTLAAALLAAGDGWALQSPKSLLVGRAVGQRTPPHLLLESKVTDPVSENVLLSKIGPEFHPKLFVLATGDQADGLYLLVGGLVSLGKAR